MLQELSATQLDREPRRRWFADDHLDLVVWLSGTDEVEVVGFELCYELRPGALAGVSGRVRYAPEFSALATPRPGGEMS